MTIKAYDFDDSMILRPQAVEPMDSNDKSCSLVVRVVVGDEIEGFKGTFVVPVVENEHKTLEIKFDDDLEIEDQQGHFACYIKTNELNREFFELLRSAANESFSTYIDEQNS